MTSILQTILLISSVPFTILVCTIVLHQTVVMFLSETNEALNFEYVPIYNAAAK